MKLTPERINLNADLYQSMLDLNGFEWVSEMIDQDIEFYGNRDLHEAVREELRRRSEEGEKRQT